VLGVVGFEGLQIYLFVPQFSAVFYKKKLGVKHNHVLNSNFIPIFYSSKRIAIKRVERSLTKFLDIKIWFFDKRSYLHKKSFT